MDHMTLEIAQAIIEGCGRHRQEHNLPPLNITVVDYAGLMTAFVRQDGSLVGSLRVSQLKAGTAAQFRLKTSEIETMTFGKEGVAAINPGMVSIPGVLPVSGGVPVFNRAGDCLGAVGVSGSDEDTDEQCAMAGLAWAESLIG